MALALIAVEYEELPALFDRLAAMAEGALLLHPARGSNVVQALHVARGDPERGQAEADLVIEDPCTKGRLNDYPRRTASLAATRRQQGRGLLDFLVAVGRGPERLPFR
jgi:CO/xanthine dehydrogenase Mo-binding subunit